jgi:hypothetical protein
MPFWMLVFVAVAGLVAYLVTGHPVGILAAAVSGLVASLELAGDDDL